jgi:hypothetical protein
MELINHKNAETYMYAITQRTSTKGLKYLKNIKKKPAAK